MIDTIKKFLLKICFGKKNHKLLWNRYQNQVLEHKLPIIVELGMIIKSVFSIFRVFVNKDNRINEGDFLIFEFSKELFEERKKYLEFFKIKKSMQFFSLYNNYIHFFKNKIKFIIEVIPKSILIMVFLPLFIFSKKNLHYLRTILFSLITSRQLKYLYNETNFYEIGFFQSYYFEVGVILNYLTSNKIPNSIVHEGYLESNNKYLVCDKLILTSHYQIHELNKYKKTIKYNFLILLGPTDSLKINITTKICNSCKKTLSFYTSGLWLRNNKDYFNKKIFDIESKNEKKLISLIKKIAKENKNYNINLFLHPIEKKHIKKSKEKYDNEFLGLKNINIKYEYNSLSCLKNSGLGIAISSSIAFSRLEFGLKTLFYNPKPSRLNEPKNTTFDLIFSETENELIKKINYWIDKDDDTMMKKLNIKPLYKRIKNIE
jgi:hypothetical protein